MASWFGGGAPARVKPSQASARDLPALQGLSEDKQSKKLESIHAGGELQDAYPPLPESRQCKDVIWALLFLATAVGVGIYAFANVQFVHDLHSYATSSSSQTGGGGQVVQPSQQGGYATDNEIRPTNFVYSVLIAMIAAMVTANLYIILAHSQTLCMVWTALIFSPVILLASGLALVFVGKEGTMIAGGILVAAALCNFCLLAIWKKYIPFTVQVLEAVTDVISKNCCMLVVPLVGSLISGAWTVMCALAVVGYVVKHKILDKDTFGNTTTAAPGAGDEAAMSSVTLFVFTLVFAWGSGVAYNISHITNCGVFARWYFKGLSSDSDSEAELMHQGGHYGGKESSPVASSFQVALCPSFGPNCLGSLIVAVVTALREVVQRAMDESSDAGNPVLCLVFCILGCLLKCIEDIIEYFNEWAYVQCAVRGTSFCESVKITYSMMTCSNMKYVVSDLLLNSVVFMGGLLCGLISALCASATEYAFGMGWTRVLVAGLVGLLIGLPIGSTSLSAISSGVKTILACYAEDAEPLRRNHQRLAEQLDSKIHDGLAGSS